MITRSEAVNLCQLARLSDVHMLMIIRRYIYDRKGIDIVLINRPTDVFMINAMFAAFNSCLMYYID